MTRHILNSLCKIMARRRSTSRWASRTANARGQFFSAWEDGTPCVAAMEGGLFSGAWLKKTSMIHYVSAFFFVFWKSRKNVAMEFLLVLLTAWGSFTMFYCLLDRSSTTELLNVVVSCYKLSRILGAKEIWMATRLGWKQGMIKRFECGFDIPARLNVFWPVPLVPKCLNPA